MVTPQETPPTPRHSVSVSGVIFDDDHSHVLLIKRRDNGHWEPPGGVLELDESIDEGLAREVMEETGAQVSVQRLTGVYKNMDRGIVALVFSCGMTGAHLRATAEAESVCWVAIEQVQQLLKPAYAARVVDALHDNGPAVRAHDGTNICASASHQ